MASTAFCVRAPVGLPKGSCRAGMRPCVAAARLSSANVPNRQGQLFKPAGSHQVMRIQASAAPRETQMPLQQQEVSPINEDEGITAPVAMASASALMLPFLTAFPAAAAAEMSDAEAAGESSIIVTVIFTLAIIALTVLTLGVVYLSVMQYLDKQQEKKDLDEFEQDPATKSILGDKGKGGAKASNKPKKERKKASARNGKGFGRSD